MYCALQWRLFCLTSWIVVPRIIFCFLFLEILEKKIENRHFLGKNLAKNSEVVIFDMLLR